MAISKKTFPWKLALSGNYFQKNSCKQVAVPFKKNTISPPNNNNQTSPFLAKFCTNERKRERELFKKKNPKISYIPYDFICFLFDKNGNSNLFPSLLIWTCCKFWKLKFFQGNPWKFVNIPFNGMCPPFWKKWQNLQNFPFTIDFNTLQFLRT